MTAMPIKTMRPPTAVKGQPNGALPVDLLQQVDRDGYLYLLAELPARGMRALHAQLRADLKVEPYTTGRGRTFAIQYGTFLARYQPVSKQTFDILPKTRRLWPDAVTKYHQTSIYWALKPPNAECAVPGTSPHGLWCADDIALEDGPDPDNLADPINAKVIEWLCVNAPKFGFYGSTTREMWHWQWGEADTIPAAVLAYEKQHEQPAPLPPTEEGEMHIGIYNTGDGRGTFLTGQCTKAGSALIVSWVQTETRLAALRANQDSVEFNQFHQEHFVACTLLGAVPPGWTAADFAEVIA